MIIAWLLGAAMSASAHDLYPIRPVQATLRVEPDQIVADLRADSIIWIEDVTGLHPMPPRNWPAQTRAKVETYVNEHFVLTAGGKPLQGRLVEGRYRQFPWEVNEEGVFFLRMAYPPPPEGAMLGGSARFYEEYRTELQGELGANPLPFKDGYRTVVEIPGRRAATFTLTIDSPSFTAPAADSRRGALAMAFESLLRGAEQALGAAAGFPILIAIAFCLGAEAPRRAMVGLLLAAAAAGFVCGRFFAGPPWLIWAATLGASLAIGRRPFEAPLAAVAAAGLGAMWAGEARPLMPHSALALPAALVGALAIGAALLFLVWLGVRSEYRRLAEVSQTRVAELFARRARLTATILAMTGAYGLWQSLQR